jgi:hypothetical protein
MEKPFSFLENRSVFMFFNAGWEMRSLLITGLNFGFGIQRPQQVLLCLFFFLRCSFCTSAGSPLQLVEASCNAQ